MPLKSTQPQNSFQSTNFTETTDLATSSSEDALQKLLKSQVTTIKNSPNLENNKSRKRKAEEMLEKTDHT